MDTVPGTVIKNMTDEEVAAATKTLNKLMAKKIAINVVAVVGVLVACRLVEKKFETTEDDNQNIPN